MGHQDNRYVKDIRAMDLSHESYESKPAVSEICHEQWDDEPAVTAHYQKIVHWLGCFMPHFSFTTPKRLNSHLRNRSFHSHAL